MISKLFTFFPYGAKRSPHSGRASAAVAYRSLAKVAGALFILGAIVHGTPAQAETASLFEQPESGQRGQRFGGSATWRTEREGAGAGHAPTLGVRADVTIPERRMTVTWLLRRNTDRSLPATHTIEVMFKLPADFPGRSIAQVPGITMKAAEQERGNPLAGLTVKVTNDFYLIGLSALQGDVTLNADILRDGKWLDILMVYANGTRAILSAEKGQSGERAFAEAFAAWKK